MEINLCIACISTYDEPDPEYFKDQIRADAISVIRMYTSHASGFAGYQSNIEEYVRETAIRIGRRNCTSQCRQDLKRDGCS